MKSVSSSSSHHAHYGRSSKKSSKSLTEMAKGPIFKRIGNNRVSTVTASSGAVVDGIHGIFGRSRKSALVSKYKVSKRKEDVVAHASSSFIAAVVEQPEALDKKWGAICKDLLSARLQSTMEQAKQHHPQNELLFQFCQVMIQDCIRNLKRLDDPNANAENDAGLRESWKHIQQQLMDETN